MGFYGIVANFLCLSALKFVIAEFMMSSYSFARFPANLNAKK
jgi:hypothetical protein